MNANRLRAVLALVLLAAPAALFAAAYDPLLPLLVDLAGWKADPPDGIDLSAAGMQGVTVVREYSSGDKGLTATIMLGDQVGVTWSPEYREGFKLVSTEGSMEVRKIDGFLVYHVFDAGDSSGGIVVLLLETAADKPGTGAVFVLAFDGMPLDEGVALAQKFDWKKMRDAAARVK